MKILEVSHPDAGSLYDCRLTLVRPDQIIAWRGDEVPDDVGALLSQVTGGARTPGKTGRAASGPEVGA